MITERYDGTLIARFDSVPQLFKEIEQNKWKPQHSKASNLAGDGKFVVFKNLEEAHHIFQDEPWRIRDFDPNDDKIKHEDGVGNDVMFDVTGDYLDIGKFMSGEPEDFGNAIMDNPNNLFAEIRVGLAAAKWTTAEYILHKQKRILRLVDWLENHKIRTRVRAYLFTEIANITVTVKHEQDPFDVNHLAIVMHPDFLRRTALLVAEQSKNWQYGYGDAVDWDDRQLTSTYVDPDAPGIHVYIGGYMPYAPDDTERGYTFENDVSKLDADFDKVEAAVQDMLRMQVQFSDAPLIVGRPFMRVERKERKEYATAE